MAVQLAQICSGRDNNLNLIRMVAASCVLVSHAWPVANGTGAIEPLQTLIGHSMGWVSVGIFFVISGFLIPRSYDTARRRADWIAARIMRLFPGLAVVLFLTILLIGPWATTLSGTAYWGDARTWIYIPRNLSLVFLQYELPGVFGEAPYVGTINGSLWTLIHEVLCYVCVFIAGVCGFLGHKRRMLIAFVAYLVFYVGLMFLPQDLVPSRAFAFRDLSFPFALGTVFYIWRERIWLSWRILAGLTLVMVAGNWTPIFDQIFLIWLAYATFVLAYIPAHAWVRAYNKIGDYSYGTYIYAFPVQQMANHLSGYDQSPWTNIMFSFPVTLVLAILSWHFVEKPGLALRGRVADGLSRMNPRAFRARAPRA
ncbi:MAG: acyltransferase [Pseudomonadota bacterium]